MKTILSTIVLLVTTFSTHAVADITPAAIPKNLHVYNSAGSTYVDHVAHGCSGARYYINPNHAKYDAIISILMAAQIAGKQVVLRYEGCNTIPQGLIIGVYLI